MKNVVITGSTRGLGLAMVKEFLKNGVKPALYPIYYDRLLTYENHDM